jgi:hypothetical protein
MAQQEAHVGHQGGQRRQAKTDEQAQVDPCLPIRGHMSGIEAD